MVLRSVVEPRDDILRQLCLMGVTLQQLFRITGINYSEFFSNLYLKFLRHRFGLGRAATFGGDGLFL